MTGSCSYAGESLSDLDRCHPTDDRRSVSSSPCTRSGQRRGRGLESRNNEFEDRPHLDLPRFSCIPFTPWMTGFALQLITVPVRFNGVGGVGTDGAAAACTSRLLLGGLCVPAESTETT